MLAAAVGGEHYWLALVAMVLGGDRCVPVPEGHRGDVHVRRRADDGEAGADRSPVPFGAKIALTIAAAVTLLVGFLPGLLDDLTDDATPVANATSSRALGGRGARLGAASSMALDRRVGAR